MNLFRVRRDTALDPLLAAESSVEEILVVEAVRESEGVVAVIVENATKMAVMRRREWTDGRNSSIYWCVCIPLMGTKHYATRLVEDITWSRASYSSGLLRVVGSSVLRPRTSKVFLCSMLLCPWNWNILLPIAKSLRTAPCSSEYRNLPK